MALKLVASFFHLLYESVFVLIFHCATMSNFIRFPKTEHYHAATWFRVLNPASTR